MRRGCDVDDLTKLGRAPIQLDPEGIVVAKRCPWSAEYVEIAEVAIEIYAKAIDDKFPELPYPGEFAEQPLYVAQIIRICREEDVSVRVELERIRMRKTRKAANAAPPTGSKINRRSAAFNKHRKP